MERTIAWSGPLHGAEARGRVALARCSPPIPQKKAEWMGHPDLKLGESGIGVGQAPTLRSECDRRGGALAFREGRRNAAWGCDLSARGHRGGTWVTRPGDHLSEAEDADGAVYLEFAAGALHLDKVIGGKPGGDAGIQGRTSPDALGVPTFKSSFETLTD